jgi:hypothetical protein
MVYRGPPSKGCGECRKRKIRCDLGIVLPICSQHLPAAGIVVVQGVGRQLTSNPEKPSCANCVSKDRVCPGYRNELDLMFCSENDNAALKVQTREKKAKARTRSSSPRDLVVSSSPVNRLSSTPEVQDVATNFFFNNYTYLGRPQGLRGYFPKMYERESPCPLFKAAAISVGTFFYLSCPSNCIMLSSMGPHLYEELNHSLDSPTIYLIYLVLSPLFLSQ